MAGKEFPRWATRLREERVRRLWSQKLTAVRLRDAADKQTQAALPAVDSIQRYVRDYEAGKHFPGDLYAELYCRAFGLTRIELFGAQATHQADAVNPDRMPTKSDSYSLASWITSTNCSDAAISYISDAISFLSGDPDAALRAAQMAESAWNSGDPRVLGTWAQVRLSAAIAYITKDDLDGAELEFFPVLSVAPEFRMSTITAYTNQIDRMLQRRRFERNAQAIEIRRQAQVFNSAALPARPAREDD